MTQPQAKPETAERHVYMVELSHEELHLIDGAVTLVETWILQDDPTAQVIGALAMKNILLYRGRVDISALIRKFTNLHERMKADHHA